MAIKAPSLDTFEWQKKALSIENDPPVSPTKGDRYLIGLSPSGAWVGKENQIATYVLAWEYTTPYEGMFLYIDQLYRFTGTAWLESQFSFDQSLNTTDDVQFNKLKLTDVFSLDSEAGVILDTSPIKLFTGIDSIVHKIGDYFESESDAMIITIGMNMDGGANGDIANYLDNNFLAELSHRFYFGSGHIFKGDYDVSAIVGGVYGGVSNNHGIQSTGNTLHSINLGFYSDVLFNGSSTDGTHNVDNVLLTGVLESRDHTLTDGVVRNMIIWVYEDIGLPGSTDSLFLPKAGDENYVILNESIYPITMRADNSKVQFGAGDDSEIYYDGTDFIINPKAVGAGIVSILGSVGVDSIYLGDDTTADQTLFEILEGSASTDRPRFQWRPDYEDIFTLTGNIYGGFSFFSPTVVAPDGTGLINFSGGNSDLAAASLDPDANETITLYDNSTGSLTDARFWQIVKAGELTGDDKNELLFQFYNGIGIGFDIVNALKIRRNGEAEFGYNLKIDTDVNTSISTDVLDVDLSALYTGLALTIPILSSGAYSTHPEVLPFSYAMGVRDRLGIFDHSSLGQSELIFSTDDFSGSASLVCDFTDQSFIFNWPVKPSDDDSYDLGAIDKRWKDFFLSGKITIGSTELTEANLISLLALI